MEDMRAHKLWIDNASYEDLLSRWRFTELGKDAIFQGEIGKYYMEVLKKKEDTVDHVAISKKIGWGKKK